MLDTERSLRSQQLSAQSWPVAITGEKHTESGPDKGSVCVATRASACDEGYLLEDAPLDGGSAVRRLRVQWVTSEVKGPVQLVAPSHPAQLTGGRGGSRHVFSGWLPLDSDFPTGKTLLPVWKVDPTRPIGATPTKGLVRLASHRGCGGGGFLPFSTEPPSSVTPLGAVCGGGSPHRGDCACAAREWARVRGSTILLSMERGGDPCGPHPRGARHQKQCANARVRGHRVPPLRWPGENRRPSAPQHHETLGARHPPG